MTDEARAFRDDIRAVTPSWLRRSVAGRLFFAFALHLDALLNMAKRAITLRYPNVFSNETLPLIARERQTVRGLFETDAQHGDRLDGAWQAHAYRGGPYALLTQIWHHYRPNNFQVDLLYPSGAHFVLAVDGTITRNAFEFGTGLTVAEWAHWYLIYAWPSIVADDGLWDDEIGDPTWDDPGVWDYATADLNAATVADLKRIPTAWGNEHSLGHIILLDPGDQLWDFPDGTWDQDNDDWDAPGGEPVVINLG